MTTPETGASAAPDIDEPAFLDALKRGDDRAFETLVRDRSTALLAVTRRILRNDDEANDALQEAFLSAFKAIDRFDGKSKLSTWLHRIAINAALMKLRKRPRSRERSIEDLLPEYLEDGHPVEPSTGWSQLPSTEAESRETGEIVRNTIDELPETYRTVLMLRDIEGLDTAETAEMLGVKPGAVKVRLHRARQALRALLDPHFREGAA